MIDPNKELRNNFILLMQSKKFKETKEKLYILFVIPKFSNIFIRVYSDYYSIAYIADTEWYIAKKQYYSDFKFDTKNLLAELLIEERMISEEIKEIVKRKHKIK
jgi:hypothetical protein